MALNLQPVAPPAFDTPEWRNLRDQRLHAWLGDLHAVRFIVHYADFCEVIDDLIDRDKEVARGDIERILFTALVDLPANPFLAAHRGMLVPVILTGIHAWLDSTDMERTGEARDRELAFVLRDNYMEVLGLCIEICRGREYLRENSVEVRRFFTRHETLAQYLEKLA